MSHAEPLRAQVLLVEDEPDHADVMAEALRKPGHVCTMVTSVDRALDELRHGSFDVIVTDLRMPGSGGRDGVAPDGADAGLVVLRAARRLQPYAETVMVTAHGDVPTARAAFKDGVYDFIEKPLDLAVFREIVNRAAETVLLRHEGAGVPRPGGAGLGGGGAGGSGGGAAGRAGGAGAAGAGASSSSSAGSGQSSAGSTAGAAGQATGSGGAAGGGAGEGLADLVQHEGFEGIIAGSEPMRRILRTVRSIAGTNLPVLITGESGTGKELIAQAVHRLSPRGKGRFVALNCAAETETLLEDQLFGHVRGAFTGAEKDREGVFEYASHGPGGVGGTLFLDEIGDMPLKMQAKLLRVLETGRVVRVGSNEERQTDVRLLSATNKDLPAMIARGEFREDLYFRIKGAQVQLPALRERREDIPRIVRHAIARAATQMGLLGPPGPPGSTNASGASGAGPARAMPGITDAAMMRLTSYPWPGNVRQLLNTVQNILVTALGEAGGPAEPGQTLILDLRHIPDDIRAPDGHGGDDDLPAGTGGGSLAGASLEQIEKRAIRETLRLTAGNREQAAKLLGIGERTLYRKLKEYGLR